MVIYIWSEHKLIILWKITVDYNQPFLTSAPAKPAPAEVFAGKQRSPFLINLTA